MATESIDELSDANFDTEVRRDQRLTLVAFCAPWSSAWRRCSLGFEQLAEIFDASRVRLARLDVDENPQTASNYSVTSLPTFLLFENGRAVSRIRGASSRSRLEQFVQASDADAQ